MKDNTCTQPKLPANIFSQLGPSYTPFTVEHGDQSRQLYARKLYGFERLAGHMSETGMGFTTFTGGVSFKLIPPDPSAPSKNRETVYSAIQRSWIRIRHLAPNVACRMYGLPDCSVGAERAMPADDLRRHEGYCSLYEVPRSKVDAERWVEETLRVHKEVGSSLRDNENQLSGHYWDPGDGQYCTELHVAESDTQGEWNLLLHGLHLNTDGRYSFSILDHLLYLLIDDLNDPREAANFTDSLAWGAEVGRLPPAAGMIVQNALAMFPDGTPKHTEAEDQAQTTPAPAIAFLRPSPQPYPEVDVHQKLESPSTDSNPQRHINYPNVSSTVILSCEQTASFRNACKMRGRTVTSAVDAILLLAEVEIVMREAAEKLDRWRDVKDMYDTATFLPVPLKFADMRSCMPADYADLWSKHSTPPFALHSLSHNHPMESLRHAVKVTEATEHCDRSGVNINLDYSEEVFWNGVVRDSAQLWETQPKPSARVFSEGQAALDASLPHSFNPAQLLAPAIASSSPGDYDAMGALRSNLSSTSKTCYGVLGRWNDTVYRTPSPKVDSQPAQPALFDARVTDLTLSVRMHKWPLRASECIQYGGRLRIHLFGSSGWYTQNDMDRWANAVKEWMLRACRCEKM